ncbi:amidohydrolase family protein [Methanosphaerula subterraneus]|uniref:amidohydrolase family protein n=1 Tax=Methanosphaerula subterraneus TaxID=3350244 RepID=UPI003F84FEFE
MVEETWCGRALIGEDFEERCVEISVLNGRIHRIEEVRAAPETWICPSFFNAHTHLGDTIAMDCAAEGDLTALVAPPDGLKHRLLRAASRQSLVSGMHLSIRRMIGGGIHGFADFREGGVDGVNALKEAAAGLPCRPVILGRDGGEAVADGAGISSVRDCPDVEGVVARARAARRPVAFHAGERDRFDVDRALSYNPDLLVHMTHATDRQLRKAADQGISIAVCPRSNWMLGVTDSRDHPPLKRMINAGCSVLLGTDNVMFVEPDLFSEMAFTSTIYRIDPRVLLHAAIDGALLTGSSPYLKEGSAAEFLLINTQNTSLIHSQDMVTSMVRRVDRSVLSNTLIKQKKE